MLVSFHDLAKVELNEAAQYYERGSRDLGEAFVTEVEPVHRRNRSTPRSRPSDPWFHTASPSAPVSVRVAVSGEAGWHPSPSGDELEASPCVLGGSVLESAAQQALHPSASSKPDSIRYGRERRRG